jgi:hypothetical protein
VFFSIVHIIELASAGEGMNNVAININARTKTTNVKHLVLVLKSHQRVQWHITAHRLRCMLDIIVSILCGFFSKHAFNRFH